MGIFSRLFGENGTTAGESNINVEQQLDLDAAKNIIRKIVGEKIKVLLSPQESWKIVRSEVNNELAKAYSAQNGKLNQSLLMIFKEDQLRAIAEDIFSKRNAQIQKHKKEREFLNFRYRPDPNRVQDGEIREEL